MMAAARASIARNSDTNAVRHFALLTAARLVPPAAWRKATAQWVDWEAPRIATQA
jgi:hypothetical protein